MSIDIKQLRVPNAQAVLTGKKTQMRRIVEGQETGQWTIPVKAKGCQWESREEKTGAVINYVWHYGDPGQWHTFHTRYGGYVITIEISKVEIKRLHEITEAEAKAEGVELRSHHTHREAFIELWEKQHGSGSWNQNPWVWIIDFIKLSP